MSTTAKHLLSALATAAFAIAATATTVTNAFAQTDASAAAPGAAARKAVADGALAAAAKADQPTGLTRAQVQAEFLEARKNGTLPETEADFDVAQTRKHVVKK
ncbi:DUF4148 domain-containing protein [Duganella callida]|uniref:DUF4148 domain-containing protein n=1 Tax=Duganella callida TaxID=2561932 RepID=A0A4Y9SJP6_9BURK|nr:DUF4148 domain-containing protein [Duganella callida]TFW22571.1 DUF4148 domain-containing protein [Duganella callida]